MVIGRKLTGGKCKGDYFLLGFVLIGPIRIGIIKNQALNPVGGL
jgi:hypothetical protein